MGRKADDHVAFFRARSRTFFGDLSFAVFVAGFGSGADETDDRGCPECLRTGLFYR
jgi:hypothetical protein